MFAFRFAVLLVAVVSLPDCYFPFLENSAGKATCSSASDCGGESKCVFSLALNRRVCCSAKAGTVLPLCPAGFDTSANTILALCESEDDCPDDYECVESATSYTTGENTPQGNKMCCKK